MFVHFPGLIHYVCVDNVADASEAHDASIFRVIHLTYIYCEDVNSTCFQNCGNIAYIKTV
jgi:hypothetical protein